MYLRNGLFKISPYIFIEPLRVLWKWGVSYILRQKKLSLFSNLCYRYV